MMSDFVEDKNIEKSKIYIIRNEMLNIFNINTTLFCIEPIPGLPCQISGTEYCLSKLEYFHCNDSINSNILEGTSVSIKKIKL